MKNWLRPWQTRLLPGLSIVSTVLLLRFAGFLQPLEWRAFDLSLRWRPAEAKDPRITIVEITEDDIQTELGYPISDQSLARLLQRLQTYQPRVIGVDIFRDISVGNWQQLLASVLESNSNIVGINRIEGPISVPAHPSLPESRIGFADALVDDDGYLRRSLLASADEEGNYRFSLTTRLVEQYVATDKLVLENGIKDRQTMRFGQTELPRLMPYTGGYVRVDNGGNQTLINFRAGQEPFEKLSYGEIMIGSVDPALLQDRIVLVGYTAESVKDFTSSAAMVSDNPSLIPGVEIQAHAVSQILSAIYDDRALLKSLPQSVDILLILGGGLMGMVVALWQRKPMLHWWVTITLSASWILLCYGLLIASWWLPLVPVLAAFSINAVGLYPLYQAKAQLEAQREERKKLINWTYNTIHNGPLQLLAGILSDWPASAPASEATKAQLEELNRELRSIYEAMHQEMLATDGTLVMTGQRTIDLKVSLDAILYETYQATLERQRSFFEKVIQITVFEPMTDSRLTSEKKRELARFLEEALINVYKYAKTATRLSVTCRQEDNFNVIRVTDNGKGARSTLCKPSLLNIGSKLQRLTIASDRTEYGTRQATRLARQLGGQFKREDIQPHGVCCELRWPVQSPVLGTWFRKNAVDKGTE